jgi:endonuclease III
MHKTERVNEIVHQLKRIYPRAKCALNFKDAYQLLIATILSAQSTDARVNEVTPALFKKYPTAAALAGASFPELEREIKSTGFFRNKARSIVGAAQTIVTRHGGIVPDSMEQLVELPGVGRKTANVVLGNAYDKTEGVVVDTHVARVSGRLGLTEHADALKIEQDLMTMIPKKEWTRFAHRLIEHGRTICIARKPKCSECRLNELCPSAQEPLI